MPLWNIKTAELNPIVELSYTEIVKNNIERVSHKIFLVLADN